MFFWDSTVNCKPLASELGAVPIVGVFGAVSEKHQEVQVSQKHPKQP